MSRKKVLDVEGRTLLIRLWKADTPIKDISYILNVSRGVIDRGLKELRVLGLIDARTEPKRLVARPTTDSKEARHNQAMRRCLRCDISFSSTHCGNRLCKNCVAAATGGRAIRR